MILSSDDDFISTEPRLVTASTHAGSIRGYRKGNILIFKGVPYAASTESTNRFRPPQPIQPWNGVRSTLHYGPVAPQDKGAGRLNDEEAFIFHWNDAVESEDCLRLNIWTPDLDDIKRPVLVWLHGGSFTAGSGHDIPAFDGENLARSGEAVVITLNHRLNLLGFLDLSWMDEDLADSGNAGMLDIVAALRWVRDNIANFGGDISRVTVFGQSGGGAKVAALMGMPSAKGLFHRAAILSGSFAMFNTPDQGNRLSTMMLRELCIGKGDISRLQQLPYGTLLTVAERVRSRTKLPSGDFIDVRQLANMLNFAPVLDERQILSCPESPMFPQAASEVPLIIGSTLNEFVNGINNPDVDAMSEAELLACVSRFAPGKADAVINAFRSATPDARPFDLWSRIAASPIRQSVIVMACRRVKSGAAQTHLFWFTWQTPILESRPRSFHCLDIPFWFNNAFKCASMTGGGREALALAHAMAGSLIAFAATGFPTTSQMPAWRPLATGDFCSMRLDGAPRMIGEIDADERASLK